MDIILNSIIFSLIFTLTPILVIYYKGGKCKYLSSIIWGIISLLLNILILRATKIEINMIACISTTIVATLVNIGIIKGSINSKKFLKLLIVLCLFFFSSIFQLIPIRLFNMDTKNISSAQDVLLTAFSDLVIIMILAYMYRNEIKKQFNDFTKNLNKYADTAFKYWLIGLGVMVISNLIINFFIPSASANNEQQVQQMIHSIPLVSIFCIGFLAPMIEEMIFRKAFFDAFNKKWVFILVSSLVFGSLHVVLSLTSPWDLLYIIPYTALGMSFAFTMAKTNNVFPSMLVHMFHNTSLTIVSIVGTTKAFMVMFL